MIIESLTALRMGKVVWEILKMLYRVYTGHVMGKAIYKGGNFIIWGIQQSLKKWQDQRNLGQ